MNFFQHQAQARRRTLLLVIPFTAAVVLIIATLNVVGYLAFAQAAGDGVAPAAADWLAQPYWIGITLGTLAVIGAGSVRTTLQLSGGGTALADMLGARPIDMGSRDADERRLINVVEEMSIASGTPVPRLYVLDDEPSINAFVAGFRPTETVMVVTRGALQHFTRDELQGVIGHEYSHIFNGDMRLNMRLMGILAGILLIGQIGRFIMRSGNRGRGKSGGQVVLLGLALFVVGYVGLFFGALIKAAISRQREFLADASAVQFTRNPDGIAGALFRIQQHAEGSRLTNSHADDVSHFCIGESVKTGFTSLFATHPPLAERIRAIDPNFLAKRGTGGASGAKRATPAAGEASASATGGGAGFAPVGGRVDAAAVVNSVGNVSAAHRALAESIHGGLPGALVESLRGTPSVTAACCALVLAGMNVAARQTGVELLREKAGAAEASRAAELVPLVTAQGPGARLVLANMALPSLKALPADARQRFIGVLQALVLADGRTSVFEFALLAILREHLAEDAGQAQNPRYFKFEAVLPEIRLLLSTLARAGGGDQAAIEATFRLGMAQFQRDPGVMAPAAHCTLSALEQALRKLALLAPMLQQPLVEACADCVIRDGRVAPSESELLQAIAVSLDCPLPPLTG